MKDTNGSNTIREATNTLWRDFGHLPPLMLAKKVGLDDAHVYRAMAGDYTKKWIKTLKRLGYLPTRVRWSPDCTPELRDAIRKQCDLLECTAGEMLELMWDAWWFQELAEHPLWPKGADNG